MASLKVTGLVELQKQIAEISELDKGEIAKKMLKEGSKDVAKVWYDETKRRHGRRPRSILKNGKSSTVMKYTGQTTTSIDTSRVRKNKIGRYTVTYPMGYEVPDRIRKRKVYRIRNAEKAFYQHYGYTNPMTGQFVNGDRFVDIIDLKAQPIAEKTMQTIWDKYLKDKQKGS